MGRGAGFAGDPGAEGTAVRGRPPIRRVFLRARRRARRARIGGLHRRGKALSAGGHAVGGFEGFAEGRLHGRRILPAVPLFEGERRIDERNDGGREAGNDAADGTRLPGRRVDEELLAARARVDVLTSDHGENRRADRPDVALAVDDRRRAERLLGGHKRGRPEEHAGARVGAGPGHGVPGAGDAEIENLYSAIGEEEQVRRLDVPVDDPLRVGGGEHVEELIGDRKGDVDRQARPQILHAAAAEQLHHEEGGAVFGHVVVDHQHDTGVLHRVRRVAFPEEPRPQFRVVGELGMEHFYSEFGLIPVGRPVDGRHPAGPEDAVEPVFAAEGRPDEGACAKKLGIVGLGRGTVSRGRR